MGFYNISHTMFLREKNVHRVLRVNNKEYKIDLNVLQVFSV